jgi:DNA (cytosine-5)-methyltransferase 1
MDWRVSLGAEERGIMRVLDLFSGIGGFSLGLSWAGSFETVAFCECEPYCQKVLRKNWPDIPIYDDIRTLTHERLEADGIIHVDVITGGFPCQPFSVAGQRRGAADDRSLWAEMARLISEVKPTWVIAENVPGIVSMELDNVLADLEAMSYAWETFIIPACGVDARHRRSRVWIVANSYSNPIWQQSKSECRGFCSSKLGKPVQDVSDSYHKRTSQQRLGYPNARQETNGTKRSCAVVSNGIGERCQELQGECAAAGTPGRGKFTAAARWKPESSMGRVAHGIPSRVDRLRGLGNAVVPQIPMMLGHFIQQAMAEGGV